MVCGLRQYLDPPPGGLRVSLPTDQIVCADDTDGYAHVGFAGMRLVKSDGRPFVFVRVRELYPRINSHQIAATRCNSIQRV